MRALLQMGTKDAIAALIAVLNDLPSGDEKSALCRELSERNSVHVRNELLAWLPMADEEVARALATSLGAYADYDTVISVTKKYDEQTAPATRNCLLQVLNCCISPKAIEALTELLEDDRYSFSDPVITMAGQALARGGTPVAVDALLRKLDVATTQDEMDSLARLIASVSQPAAQATLLYAAKGNKSSTRAETQLAAISALENYPLSETLTVLQQLQQSSNPKLRDAANKAVRRGQADGPP